MQLTPSLAQRTQVLRSPSRPPLAAENRRPAVTPQFGMCPVCWTVGGMAVLGSIPFVGGFLSKVINSLRPGGKTPSASKAPSNAAPQDAALAPQGSSLTVLSNNPCEKTGDTFCGCSQKPA